MKNETKNVQNLPKELIFELIRFIPFNSKWDNTLISKFFNFLIIKFQRKWRIYINKVYDFESLRTSVAQEFNGMIVNLKEIENPGSHVGVNEVDNLNGQLGVVFGQLNIIEKLIPSHSAAIKSFIDLKTWSAGGTHVGDFDTKQKKVIEVLEFIKNKVVGNLGEAELNALNGYIICLAQGVSEILEYYNRKCAQD
ncbi:unnamed protein product [Meloidogyne enterolobii]|uniref:Uncharacterized protein n=1 Tax=Meloidogyne enterolobii TaxID=390850 RepID=A0ACB1ASB5_MELEN